MGWTRLVEGSQKFDLVKVSIYLEVSPVLAVVLLVLLPQNCPALCNTFDSCISLHHQHRRLIY